MPVLTPQKGKVRMSKVRTAKAGAALALLLVALILVPVALAAAHGGDPNVIHACVRQEGGGDSFGRVRIVGPNDPCRNREIAVHWSIGGPPGPTGQTGTSAFGTESVAIASETAFTAVPGLAVTIVVPANSFVFVSTDGGVSTNSVVDDGFSVVDVAVFIDGVLVANGGSRRVTAVNNAQLVGITNYSIAFGTHLTVGSHTIQVAAVLAAGVLGNNSATVSGGSHSVLQGQLTVIVIKQ